MKTIYTVIAFFGQDSTGTSFGTFEKRDLAEQCLVGVAARPNCSSAHIQVDEVPEKPPMIPNVPLL